MLCAAECTNYEMPAAPPAAPPATPAPPAATQRLRQVTVRVTVTVTVTATATATSKAKAKQNTFHVLLLKLPDNVLPTGIQWQKEKQCTRDASQQIPCKYHCDCAHRYSIYLKHIQIVCGIFIKL